MLHSLNDATAPRPPRRGRVVTMWAFAGPALTLIGLFSIAPLVVVALLTFVRFDAFTQSITWVGFANWTSAFDTSGVLSALRNTVVYTVIAVPVQVIAALLIALAIHSLARGTTFWRVAYFLPTAATLSAVAVAWRWMFYPDSGLVDSAVGWVGLSDWLHDPTTALIAVALVGAWHGVGASMVMFLAGLSNVSPAVSDAARIDHAGAWHRFWAVSWPVLGPSTVFAVVIATRDSFNAFDQIQVMTQGGPLQGTVNLTYLQWQIGIGSLNVGVGSVVNLVLLGIVLITVWAQYRLSRAGRRSTGVL